MVSMLHFKQKLFTRQIFNEMMITFFNVKASAKTSQNIRESCLLTLSLWIRINKNIFPFQRVENAINIVMIS